VAAEPDLGSLQKLKIKSGESKILVVLRRYQEYKYLDKLKLSGKLEEPGKFSEDVFSQSYKNYLAKDGIYSVMNFPEAKLTGKSNRGFASAVYSGVLWIKQKIRESVRQNFSPPESSILEGTILGDNGAMSKELKDKLNITGLRHIIAVSGTHVVILSSIVMSLLLAIGLWRGQAFYIAIILIFFYIVLTGLPASGIRAGIMGGLYLLAQKFGRQSMGLRVVAMACAVMLFINPLLLFYDVGFQLSFLAVLGLIYLEPFIRKLFKFLVKKLFKIEVREKGENLFMVISATLAAQVFTLPVMVFNFGNISFVSPLTNLLIAPAVEPLMILGFLASFSGMLFSWLGWIISVPCHIFLYYFIFIIDFFSQPWAAKTIQGATWPWLAGSYILLIIFVRYLRKRFKKIIV